MVIVWPTCPDALVEVTKKELTFPVTLFEVAESELTLSPLVH